MSLSKIKKCNIAFVLFIKVMFFIIIIAVMPVITHAQSADETAIKQLLATQTNAWNSGSIETFMKGYLQSDSLQFIGKSGVIYGYATTLENYRKRYPDTTAMGKLTFDLLHLNRLSAEYYYVVGKWHLQRSIGNIGGHFTLLFKKINNEWFIISDHSS